MSGGRELSTTATKVRGLRGLDPPRFSAFKRNGIDGVAFWLQRYRSLVAPLALLPLFLAAELWFAGHSQTTRILMMLALALFYSAYAVVTLMRLEGNLIRRHMRFEGEMLRRLDEFSPNEVRLSRQYFEGRLAQEINRSRRHHLPLSLVTLSTAPERDKVVHTSHLIEVTARYLRAEDSAGRLGRYVYAICLPHTTRSGAEVVIERLRNEFDGQQPQFGVACLEPGGEATPEQLLQMALGHQLAVIAA
jgi:hypothetical protein